MAPVRQLLSPDFWWRGDRPWYPALGVSTLLHITAIIALGLVWTRVDRGPSPAGVVESRWTPESALEQKVELTTLALPTADQSIDPGGRPSARVTAPPAEPVQPVVSAPATELIVTDPDLETLFESHLTEVVGALTVSGGGPDSLSIGEGNGEGRGTGDGEGQNFFGIRADGRRFVYLVDCSRSMNHPHDSQWKTRFRRLKFEILKSVGAMTADQEFFIIFFSDGAHPMPAATLQPATPWAKQRYLKWMAGRVADGDTEPREALTLALRLQPDVIYFLTDGSFNYRTNEFLKKLRQKRTAIHTFCFGDRAGEEILRFVAQNNGGEYHFVP